MGNIAVHDATPIDTNDALHLVEELFHVLFWLSRFYSPNAKNHPNVNFDSKLIHNPKSKIPNPKSNDLSQEQLQKLKEQISLADQMRQIAEARANQTEEEITVLKAEIAAIKQQNEAVTDSHNYNEAETRRYLIDVLLKEAGWDIYQPGWTEYEVSSLTVKNKALSIQTLLMNSKTWKRLMFQDILVLVLINTVKRSKRIFALTKTTLLLLN